MPVRKRTASPKRGQRQQQQPTGRSPSPRAGGGKRTSASPSRRTTAANGKGRKKTHDDDPISGKTTAADTAEADKEVAVARYRLPKLPTSWAEDLREWFGRPLLRINEVAPYLQFNKYIVEGYTNPYRHYWYQIHETREGASNEAATEAKTNANTTHSRQPTHVHERLDGRLSARELLFQLVFGVFKINNETFNVYSHLVMVFFFVYLFFCPPIPPFFIPLTAAPADGVATTLLDPAGITGSSAADRFYHRSLQQLYGAKAAAPTTTYAARSANHRTGDGGLLGRFGFGFIRRLDGGTVDKEAEEEAFRRSTALRDDTYAAEETSRPYFHPRRLFRPLCVSFAITFMLSFCYHFFMPYCDHSPYAYAVLLQCDVCGIIFSMASAAYCFLARGIGPPPGYYRRHYQYHSQFYAGGGGRGGGAPAGEGAAGVSTSAADMLSDAASRSARLSYYGRFAFCSAILIGSSLATAYVLVVAPLQRFLVDVVYRSVLRRAVLFVFFALGELLIVFAETVCQQRLRAPHPESTNLAHIWLYQLRCQFRRSVQRYVEEGEQNSGVGGSAHNNGSARSGPSSSGPVFRPVNNRQRALVLVVYLGSLFVSYALLILPKYRRHSFHQAAYYHFAAFLILFIGGACNSARFPEKIFYTVQKKRREAQRVQYYSAHAGRGASASRKSASLSSLHRQDSLASNHNGLASNYDYNDRAHWFCNHPLVSFFLKHICSLKELCYAGNSHNIWHICSVLSTLCTVMGAYYDCVEYELIYYD